MTKSSRNVSFFQAVWPVLLWAAVIFAASSVPSNVIPPTGFFEMDKLLHAGVFGVFCGLFYRTLVVRATPMDDRRALLISIFATAVYGAADEFHQYFVPGRVVDFYDWLADVTGAIVCVLLILSVKRLRRVAPEAPPR